MAILRPKHAQQQQQEQTLDEALRLVTAALNAGTFGSRNAVPTASDAGGHYNADGEWEPFLRCDTDAIEDAGCAP